MTKDLMVIALGVWVAIVPFLGFPNQWDTIIFIISGLFIVALVLLLRRDLVKYVERIKSQRIEKTEHVFEESVVPKHNGIDVPLPDSPAYPPPPSYPPSPQDISHLHNPPQDNYSPRSHRRVQRKRLTVIDEDNQETHS
ncbi:MAG TPA: hypothetical protein VJH21_00470 [Candidatus Paceibacterota bacterium]